ncbi:SusC/RagA family TonB-linked outer membrane protein [Mucilaginibacter sp. AW1-3]
MKKSLLILFLAMCCCTIEVMAQTLIAGKVTSSDDGVPLPGVTVKIKDTKITTVTDVSGAYSIRASSGQVLQFSYIGYLPQNITVKGTAPINVSLQSDSKSLSEVVVTAFNIPRDKASLGYSAQKVAGDDVSQSQREDFFGGLQGRVAGLSVNSTNGNPGASAQIVLRGFTSVSGDNNALIVVDGVPINNTTLNQTFALVSQGANRDQDYSNRGMDINPADIDSYTIMKGPEATALYGSAGAGGAILITTKKGKAGAANVTYSTSYRIEKLVKFPQIQTEYNTGTVGGVFDGTSSSFFGPKFLPGTQIYDNFNNFFQTGRAMKHNISVDGGTDKLTYRWSNEYSDNKGTIPSTEYQRFSSRLTGSAVISPLIKVTTSMNYINSTNDKAYKGQNGILMELMRFSPAFDIRNYQDVNGNRITHQSTIYGEFDNPLWSVNKDPQQDKVDRFLGNVSINITPTKWLGINAIFGADITSTNGSNVYNGQSYKGSGSSTAPTGGYILTYQDLSKLYNGSLTATAKSKMGSITGTYIIGATFDDFNSTTNSQSGNKFYDPNFYSINNTLPTTRQAAVNVVRYRDVGLFGQAIFGYKNLLYLTLTGRVDGVSKLMPSINASTGVKADGDPYFAYPSGSLAFNFTELEAVKKALPFIDYGKLRVSYALTGKGPFRQYALGSVYNGANTTGGGYALSVNGGNPDLRPETTHNFETGVEMQFLNGRLGIDFNYYNLESINQIIFPRLSYGSGFVLKLLNGGEVRNRGIEVVLNGTPVKSRDFSWDVNLNYSQNRGTVISLADQLPELYDSDTQIVGSLRSAAWPGASTGNVTGWKYDRNKFGQVVISSSTGLPIVSDLTYYPIGDRTPKFTLGIVNKFTYKRLSFSMLWDLRYGGDVINQTEFEAYTKGISIKTLDRETPRIITGVLNDGLQNTDHPTPNNIAITPYSNSGYFTNPAPEVFVEHNIKAFRLRDATIAYDLPQSLLSRTGFIKNLNVFFTVTDAILITNYTGLDPESNSLTAGSGGIGGYGIDYGNIGKPIGYNLGLRVKL